MDRMAPATWAKLLDGELFGLALLILGRDIIAPFTPVALEPDKISHFSSPLGQNFRLSRLIG
jgi:hypothetical protein